MSINTGLTRSSVKRLKPDSSISTALDGYPQTSNPRHWKVLQWLKDTSEGPHDRSFFSHIISTGDSFANTLFLNKVFPTERKIPRCMKKKDTLNINVFCILYRQHWIYLRFFCHGNSVCYRNIELFILKDPNSKRDVLCAIIEFCNLKGRPEGADRTKFFMHGDYQMAYCPINQIILLAFHDGAFVNPLTLELIWQL
ncbi:hypothetical protein IFM47457_05775 [Aspergillus lentulus]|nr:hypothetical protein IFM47457_05775 [Aspergillus lentulus]